MKRRIVPGEIEVKDMHQFIIGSVAPRPIAFVSTLDENGTVNLAPFSFFGAFSSNPPVLVFSANRRVRDNTTKHTLHNIRTTKECVINVVTHDIIRQTSLASVEYGADESEFVKTGLTPEASEMVAPPRVKESPVNFECKLQQIIPLGDKGGAGHLIICDVKLIHISESVIDGQRINPHKIDLMGRLGRNYFVRASGDALSEIYQPVLEIGIGFDGLRSDIRDSKHLSGNDLGYLAALTAIPTKDEVSVDSSWYSLEENLRHQKASELIKDGKVKEAMAVLYYGQ